MPLAHNRVHAINDVLSPSAASAFYRVARLGAPEKLDMAFSIRNEAVDRAVRRLATLKNKNLTETILEAVENEYRRVCDETSLVDRLAAVSARYRAFPETGAAAEKAFFDEMSGDN
jgi:antitoxin VapB